MGIRNLFISFILLCNVTFCSDTCDDGEINCTDQFVYGLNITVKDATTNSVIIEGITVVITDGDYQEELMFMEGFGNFVGAGEREGNYTIAVSSNNYQSFTSEVIEVNGDRCHVIPESVEILLQPN